MNNDYKVYPAYVSERPTSFSTLYCGFFYDTTVKMNIQTEYRIDNETKRKIAVAVRDAAEKVMKDAK